MSVSMTCVLAFLPSMGPMEMLIVGVIAVLLFGKRLPEVGRSLGKGIVEFKKGLHGIEDEVNTASTATSRVSHSSSVDDREQTTAPKFEPPTSEPKPDEAAHA
jgi:sec-independent protein translocase protein TatA